MPSRPAASAKPAASGLPKPLSAWITTARRPPSATDRYSASARPMSLVLKTGRKVVAARVMPSPCAVGAMAASPAAA